MHKLNRLLGAALFAFCVNTGQLFAQTLSLPDNLIDFNSKQGSQIFLHSEALQSYWPLSIHFETQKNQAFCGVASIVMVLNALGIPAPTTPEIEPYKTFTQENVFNARSEAVLPEKVLLEKGMTLDQIGAFVTTYPVEAQVVHAADTTVDIPSGQRHENTSSLPVITLSSTISGNPLVRSAAAISLRSLLTMLTQTDF